MLSSPPAGRVETTVCTRRIVHSNTVTEEVVRHPARWDVGAGMDCQEDRRRRLSVSKGGASVLGWVEASCSSFK